MCGRIRTWHRRRLSRMKQPRCLKVFWKVLAQGKIQSLATTEGGGVLSLRHHIVSIFVVCFKSISVHRVIIMQCSKGQPLFGWFCLCVHVAQRLLTVLSTIPIGPGRSGLGKVLIRQFRVWITFSVFFYKTNKQKKHLFSFSFYILLSNVIIMMIYGRNIFGKSQTLLPWRLFKAQCRKKWWTYPGRGAGVSEDCWLTREGNGGDCWCWGFHTPHQSQHHPGPLIQGQQTVCSFGSRIWGEESDAQAQMLPTGLILKHIYLFSRLPFPVSLKPLAKGLLSIFSCVIFREKSKLRNQSVERCSSAQLWEVYDVSLLWFQVRLQIMEQTDAVFVGRTIYNLQAFKVITRKLEPWGKPHFFLGNRCSCSLVPQNVTVGLI